jgi:hypothetical protein
MVIIIKHAFVYEANRKTNLRHEINSRKMHTIYYILSISAFLVKETSFNEILSVLELVARKYSHEDGRDCQLIGLF